MTTPDRTLTHWPDWMRTAGALLRSNSLVRSHCRVCGALLRIDLASLVARHGADWNLIDRRERCAIVGCAGTSVYLEIGRASCRERVGQYVYIPVVAGSLTKKKTTQTQKQ